jgi:radical SAM-linked protein
VAETVFRLRLNFRKQGRLRFLSHLEVVRAMERMIRRARLPSVVSRGFNVHMRYAPGPALPVGTVGLDEYFDVWLTDYLASPEVLRRLEAAGVAGLDVVGASYVDPRAKGLQATHIHEVYEVVLEAGALTAAELRSRLIRLIESGSLTVLRRNKKKVYDLTQSVERPPEVREARSALDVSDKLLIVTLELRAMEQGSVRPELLLKAALEDVADWRLYPVTRVRLYADGDAEPPAGADAG